VESAWYDIVAVLKSVRNKVKAVMHSDKIKVITWDRLYEATQEDPVMIRLVEMIYRGFTQRSYDVDEEISWWWGTDSQDG
jgi:hypothetical protein